MRNAGLIALSVLVGLTIRASAAPPDFWSGKKSDAAALDAAATTLPQPIQKCVFFEKLLVRLRSGAAVATWQAEMEEYAKADGDQPAVAAMRETAKAWLARVRMLQIDRALRGYFRKQVRFPDTLAAVQANIPAEAKTDPWGEPWVYRPTAPKGFSAKFSNQRYQLGPTRAPLLLPLEDAIKDQPAPRAWKITPRETGGVRAIEIRSADGRSAVVQPGAHFADATLAFIGDGWALFADTERLFAVTF